MIVGATYRVDTGTLTMKSVTAGKNKTFILWYESDIPEYSREVSMTEENMKRMDSLRRRVR